MSYIQRDFREFYNLQWLDDYMIGHNGFIAGGCFKNIFNKEKVKDIDIFFKSSFDHAVAESYYRSIQDNYIYYQNDKTICFKNKKKPDINIELIRRVFGTPEEILNMFDFSVTKFAYYKETKTDEFGADHIVYKIIHHPDFFEHLHFKRLVTEADIKFPVGTFERMFRYAKYGYFPCKETKARIIRNLREKSIPGDDISASLYEGLD